MKLLNKNAFGNNFFKEPIDKDSHNSQRGLSLTLREHNDDVSLKKSFILAVLLHPLLIAIFWILTQIIFLLFPVLGIHIPIIPKPEPKVQDIDFVLKNQKKERVIVHQKPVFIPQSQKPFLSPKPDNKPKADSAKQGGGKSNKPMSETVIPLSKNLHKGFRLPTKKFADVFSIPMPKIKPLSSDIGFGGKGTPGYTSAHASRTSRISSGGGYSGSGSSNVAGKGARQGGGYGYGSGGNGAPKIGRTSGKYNDLLGDANLNPYITELQRRIKRNWNPPKNNEDKKVVLFLRIAKDGRVLIMNVKNTSENADADNAAISAVKRTQPFRPLPSDYKENYVDAVFTFDYNINSVGGRY